MGTKLGTEAAVVKRGTPAEPLKQVQEKKVQGEGHTQDKGISTIASCESSPEPTPCSQDEGIRTTASCEGSPEPTPCTQSLCPHRQLCHAQPVQNSLPDGFPEDNNSLLQLVQENEKYRSLHEEAKKRNRHLTCENHNQRQMIKNMCNELDGLQHNLQKHQWHINSLNKQVKEYQENCRDLSLKIERAEHLYSQQSMADSGSYQESAATPPMLQVAADSVKDAITSCASELFSRIKKNSLPINIVHMNLDSKETGQIIKVTLQSFLCHALFKGFEDPFFCASDGLPLFMKPASRKTHLLQDYKRFRDSDARQMLDKETEFMHFFGAKESELCVQLKEQFLTMEDVQKTEDLIISELCSRNNNYFTKLLRLVKAVWVLHKLAFAFEPSAEIFRVGQGSILDEEFMENVAVDDDDDDDDDNEDEIMSKRLRRVKQVKFMCVPGFIVRHTIIKSRVFCLESSEQNIHSQTEDPSPMTVD